MKNLKNKIAAIGLMTVLGMSATAAKAGILISDKAASADGGQCKATSEDWKSEVSGVIVVGLNGVIVVGLNGLLMSDGFILSDGKCDDTKMSNGILISD